MIEVIYARSFIKGFIRPHPDVRDMAEKKEELFKDNPFHPSLKTHSLSGKMNSLWSFSVNRKYRIIFSFDSGRKAVGFIEIGTHDLYE